MKSVFVIALWGMLGIGCAPLTLPAPPATGAVADSAAADSAPVSALERYLHLRQLKTDSTAVVLPYMAVLPFADQSGFREGVWDVEHEMARLLSARMSLQPDWHTVPYEAVGEVVGKTRKIKQEQALLAGRRLEADFVILGRLLDYDLRRLSVGDPMLGGYKSYAGVAEIELRVLRVHDESEFDLLRTRKETIDRGVGLDLFGKPRDRDLQFVNLGKIPFGSPDFDSTAIGEATRETMSELINRLIEMIKPSGLRLEGELAQILSVYGDEVYINIGSENGLHSGYRFGVYPGVERVASEVLDGLRRVAVVQVKEVIGARLASVLVLEGKEWIKAGDRLQLIQGEEEPTDPQEEKAQ
ncbi:MAG: hypothetical protein FJY95_13835 [Candidatus Handelsmanbacteria bacterium]|nr:hypothetical protein [Candidatus Handelsmanbacteria bacterium]